MWKTTPILSGVDRNFENVLSFFFLNSGTNAPAAYRISNFRDVNATGVDSSPTLRSHLSNAVMTVVSSGGNSVADPPYGN